jgi:glutamate/tyrosine decarboxylase-like PLP-dependent enzyme
LSKKVGYLFNALSEFDATVIDPHKALSTPYSNGGVAYRDARHHARLAMGVRAPYIGFDETEAEIMANLLKGTGSHGQKRVEGSMGAGPILSVVAVLRTLGMEGLSTVYDLTLDRTARLYQRVQESPHLEPVHKPELNLLCFGLSREAEARLGITDRNEEKEKAKRKEFIERTRLKLDNNIEGEGGYFFSATDLPLDPGGENAPTRYVWRACIMNPRTTDQIVDAAVAGLEELIEAEIDNR